jgi:hypothetical protein
LSDEQRDAGLPPSLKPVGGFRDDEEFPSAADAIDRMDQLEARGIEAEMVEIVARRRRRIA